jgi:hypothetical protein
MEVSGKLNDPAALLPGKEPLIITKFLCKNHMVTYVCPRERNLVRYGRIIVT